VSKTESKGSKGSSSLPPRVRCPVCGGKGTPADGEVEGDGLVTCSGCGLEFVGSPLPRRFLTERRDEKFKDCWAVEHGPEIKRAADDVPGIMAAFFGHTEGFARIRNAFGRNVLDTRCGLGFRLRRFEDYGWTAYGLEPSAAAVVYAKGCSLDVKQGWFDDPGQGPGPMHLAGHFDLVLFMDNFGGLPEPVTAVKTLEKILRPGGLVFVETGSGEGMDRLFHFTAETLRRLFVDNGFSVLEEGAHEARAFAWFGRKSDRQKAKPAMAEAVLVAATPA
jgi:SAM-dependent methyltransferase